MWNHLHIIAMLQKYLIQQNQLIKNILKAFMLNFILIFEFIYTLYYQ